MSTRISSAGFALILAACGPDMGGADPDDDRPVIACALAGAESFSDSCRIAQTETGQGSLLIVSHPDGGFRRLRVTQDRRYVVAADGAEPAQVTPRGEEQIEIALGADRYRLPATVLVGQ